MTSEITTAYKALNDTKVASPTNWLLVSVNKDTKALEIATSGSGLSSLHDALDDSKLQFAALKVTGIEQSSVTSKRPKIVQINWVGPSVPPMQRKNALAFKQEISSLFAGVATVIDAVSKDDLSQKVLADKLLTSGGAHKPSYYDFGNEEHYQLEAPNQ